MVFVSAEPGASIRARAIKRCALGVALAMGLAACSLGPDYKRPDITPPEKWTTDPGSTGAPWPSADWWRGFGSPQLDQFISDARSANDDLAAAMARVQEADAQARVAGAPLLPSLEATGAATRERQPVSGQGYQTYNQFSPLLAASYEIDFWGKNRAAHESALATAAASRFDRETVELSVMTSVAGSYFQSLELLDRLEVAQNNLAAARAILRGLEREQVAGTSTALDVAQQETVVATLDAAIPPLRQQLRQSTDALAILLGKTPESIEIHAGSLAGLHEPALRAGLPSELLARRPDVANAEELLIAANADIRVARASFFPSISLTANGGFISSSLSTVTSPANRVFQLSAGVVQPIFEGGALEGQYDYTSARYTELLANYHKAVLSAFGNVEDALAGVQQTAEQQLRQQRALEKAQLAYELSRAQLRAGTINILTVLNTESALFGAQDALIQVRYAHLQSLLSLYSALGGGWQQTSEIQ